jgi:hypothetical protein
MKSKTQKINTKGVEVSIMQHTSNDYISLTDMARYKNPDEPKDVVKNWMKNYSTIEYIGIWETLNNPNFKGVEFDSFKNQAGSNSFTLSPQKWIETTNAIGIISKSGNGGGTFAHKDIAFEFASWISAEFKLYLIKEFQRLKIDENERLNLGWDAKRHLTKINYRIHTDSIKENIILPNKIIKSKISGVYATEADMLNVLVFGITAEEWKRENKEKDGNIRDYANVSQLVILANVESLNAEYIRSGVNMQDRFAKLKISVDMQMKSLLGNSSIKKLEK